ncbi:hypothetical protein [Rhizobium sp. CC-YZS058]|uniref:hypothetical protein n=1 Tax=Rhizobium sp. CC-YZS058 TaxID=3042153 RepID=UPI002B0526C7|nr:hypothetical protein [Rhizobium sp. CC-YZS058]MEA3533727.1 hypothetical protein [Rhizobium sp. CC-YZS058]
MNAQLEPFLFIVGETVILDEVDAEACKLVAEIVVYRGDLMGIGAAEALVAPDLGRIRQFFARPFSRVIASS